MESFNEETQRAKVQAGLKGGASTFNKLITHPDMQITDTRPAELNGKFAPIGMAKTGSPTQVWPTK